jgi:hypothetical protein
MVVVYKYLSPDLKECYVGSTKNECHRKSVHKSMKGRCTSKKLFEKYGYDNCSYIVLEICSLEEQRIKEQWWLDHAIGAVNKKKAFQTEEERYNQKRAYSENHKDQKKAIDLIYREVNKDKIKEYNEANKERKRIYHKAYYEKKIKSRSD